MVKKSWQMCCKLFFKQLHQIAVERVDKFDNLITFKVIEKTSRNRGKLQRDNYIHSKLIFYSNNAEL